MNYIIKRYSILSLLLLLCGVVGQAQTLVFEQSYNSAISSITTSSFNLSGNALIALRVKASESSNITFSVSSTTGSLRGTSYSVSRNKSTLYGIPVYLDNGGANTQLTISVSGDKTVYLGSIRIYDIGDAIFYESFDAMEGYENNPFSTRSFAYVRNCDNVDGSELNNVDQSYKNIVTQASSSYYKMPPIDVSDAISYLLSFKMANFNNSGSSFLTLECSDDAKITMINTGDLSDVKNSRTYSLPGDYWVWHDYFTVITGMTDNTVLTFTNSRYNLDNILLTPIPTLLDEAANNITYIKGHAGQTTDVELRRTLTANVWCPLCLPFDVTPESFATAANAVAADANPVLRKFTSVSEGVFTFDVVPAATTIAAGTPFLVKVTKQVTNPTFANVTVVNTPAKAVPANSEAVPANSDYQFVGTYSPVNLNTDGTHLFLGTNGTLYKPGTTAGYNHMNGLRAYFQIPAAALGTRISLPGDETTAIQDINDDGYQFEHRFDSEAVRTQNLLPRQITIREGRKYLSK